MREPARVLHVLGTGEAHAKGIAQIVANLARHMDPRRYRVSVIFLREDGPAGERLRSAGVDARPVRWERGWKDVRGVGRFVRALRQAHPDIIHLHAGGLSPRLVAKMATGSRVVVHFHSLAEESGRGKRRSALAADLVIANSEATARSVHGHAPLVVYPGVNVPPRRKPRTNVGDIVIGVAARLTPVKGISFLLSAMQLLLRDGAPVVLQVAGVGPARDGLLHEAESLGIADSVQFIGWRDDVTGLMNDWDIYVQPSLAEGFGIAVLEAMAAGLPVVATSVGGLREIVENGETGWLVAPADATALAKCIGSLARDPESRSRMGDAGRARAAANFSLDREAAAIQSAYDRLLA